MKKKLVIWGASGFSLDVANAVVLEGKYEIAGFLDDINTEKRGKKHGGAHILGGKEQLDQLPNMNIKHLAFGFGDITARLRLSELVMAKGLILTNVIHPKSIIADDAIIGSGVFVGPGAIIDSGTKIGDHAMVNHLALVGHGSVLEEGAFIAPGALLAGNVTVGRETWIGIGVVVKEGVSIGRRSVIGAGAVVVHDIPHGVVGRGSPCKVTRQTAEKDS